MIRPTLLLLLPLAGCSFVVAPLEPVTLDLGTPFDSSAPDLTAPTCTDGIKNGAETDIDCGGAECPRCALLKACAAPGDCVSAACVKMVCTPASCTDGFKNEMETDVDCGGGCPACDAGKMCVKPSDCPSNGFCSNGVCSCTADFFGNQCLAPQSCRDLRAQDGTVATGLATIDVDGAGPMAQFQVYCNMDAAKDGGGWTRLVTQNVTVNANYFADAPSALATAAGQPSADLYSILGLVDSFARNGSYEFLYWNRDHDKWVTSTQTDSPLNMANLGRCPGGYALGTSNFTPNSFCGFAPGPVGLGTLASDGNNYDYLVAQLMAYSNYPLLCTFPDNERCSWVEFYVR